VPRGMVIAVISDTHLPRGRRRIPDGCLERLRGADLIVHAGDLSDVAVLGDLEALGEVHAVHGNADTPEIRALLPDRCLVEAGGARIGMVHDTGPSKGRLERLRRWFPDVDAVIFGHSHIALHERAPDGFQIFNPGSPTERRRQPRHTMGIAVVNRGEIDFEVVELD